MRIGDVARQAGVTAKAIRFWEAEGLVPDPPRTASGYRDYDDGVVDRLAEVEARIAELTATSRRLQTLARRADAQDPADCSGYCAIITG